MKKLALLTAALMLVMSVAGCGAAKPTNPSGSAAPGASDAIGASNVATAPAVSPMATWDGKDLSVIVGPNPDTIDPALNSTVDGGTLVKHVFEGLFVLDTAGVPVPGTAEKVDVSADLLTYTFTIRANAKWSDGQDLTAEDFVLAWNRVIDPATAADYANIFDCVARKPDGKLDISASDAKTLVVKLIAPTAYFLELTAFPTYMPTRKDMTDQGEKWTQKPETYIGNGPYMVKEWVPNSHILMVKNPNYWDLASLKPESIKFNLTDDDVAQLSAYKNGTVSFIDNVPTDEIEALQLSPDYYVAPQIGTYYVSFNVKKAPLDNPKVRKALTLAIDRDWLVTNVSKANQIPAGAYVPPVLSDATAGSSFRTSKPFYFDPSFEAFDANLAEAKALLAEAGYPEGKDFPTITYLYNAATSHQQIGEALQNMWKELGITVNLESQEWSTFLNSRKNGDYFIARNGWLGDYNDPISFLDMWVTGGGNNDAQWSNTSFDALIKEAKGTGDQAVRMQKMHEAEDIIFNESMLCPLYYYTDIYMQSPMIDGVVCSPLGFKSFAYAVPKA